MRFINKKWILTNSSKQALLVIAYAFIVLSSLALVTPKLKAQQLIYDHFGMREGLSSRVVTDVIYDRQNLVWIATDNGLNRFDGYEFITFSNNENLASQYKLSQRQIKKLALASDGRIIILYKDLYSSFDIIDPITFQIEKIEVLLKVDGEPRSLCVDKKGDIYALSKTQSSTSISVFNYTNSQFNQVCNANENWNTEHATVNFIPTQTGKYIIYDEEIGLRLFSPNGTVGYIPLPENHSNLFENATNLSFLHTANDGTIWLSYQDRPGVFRLDENNLKSKLFSELSDKETYSNIWEDKAGNLIFNQAENRGNYPYSKQLWCLEKGRSIINFSHLLGVGSYILSIYGHDFLQSIFISTDTGLKVVQNSTTLVEQYLAQNIGEDQRGNTMRGMCTDGKGSVYFSREINCWYKLDLATKLLDTIYLFDSNNKQLNFTRAQGILYDTAGYIWGTSGDGTGRTIGLLHRYDIENCTNKIYYYKDNFTAYGQTPDERIWLGTSTRSGRNALVYFDKTTEKFTPFLDENEQNPFINAHIHFILSEGDEILWIGTVQGLFKINTSSNTWIHYMKGNHSLFPIAQRVDMSDNVIFSLYKSHNDVLWIGTLNGLTSFDPSKNKWGKFYKHDGLASETVASILPGKNNAMWISTYNGLSYFTPNRDQSRRFFSINGLSHNEFNRFSSLIDENGFYYFGGVNGINVFKPDELLMSPPIPKVLLTAFTEFNSSTDSTITHYSNLIDFSKDVVIKPNIRFFSFDFALPIYTPTMDNQFRYRIDKDAQEWIYLRKNHRLRFNNLTAGRYVILVQGADSSGNWSKESLVINLLVKQVFYLRWWFLFLIGLFIIGIVYVMLRYRLEEKLRMERLRTQLASDLHDEVSGLLAGISLQSELLRSQVKEEHMAAKLQNIREASQRAMSKISDVIWSIDSRRDKVENLITRMEEHADEVLLPINIRYKINTKELDPMAAIPANIRQDVYFIYKEAINNVVKHANADFVNIHMVNNGPLFEMVIMDNGKPQKTVSENTRKRKGQGISNLRMRAQRLNAELDILITPNYTIQLRMKRFS